MIESVCCSYAEELVCAGLKQVGGICPDCGNSVSKHQRKPKICNLYLEDFLENGFDQFTGKCPSCSSFVSIHSRRSSAPLRFFLYSVTLHCH